jgi:DNA-directed RNA polymerase subunit RPC12/RpoP
MNLYDTKSIVCSQCGKAIGEIEYDSDVKFPQCGRCFLLTSKLVPCA